MHRLMRALSCSPARAFLRPAPAPRPRAVLRAVALAFVTLSAACAANPSPVHVVGTLSEMSLLTGQWEGEYTSVETGRSGSISFSLRAGTDSAFGDVVMVPRALAPTNADVRAPGGAIPATPQVIPIAFVRAATNVISGTLDPYKSPDCGCTLTTVFRGTITGNRIEGNFTTSHSDRSAPQQKGTWWVMRKATPPAR